MSSLYVCNVITYKLDIAVITYRLDIAVITY